jgi:hypothetical protein
VADETRGAAAEHDRHDRELIARAAAGDVAGIDGARATALLATCGECRQLELDLRVIAAASRTLAASSPPVIAPRDFRLSADDVAELRRRGPAGWLPGAWGWSRLAWTRLGRGLVGVGVAGLLVAVIQGGILPGTGGGESGATDVARDRGTLAPALAAPAPSAYAVMATGAPAQPDQAPSPTATGPAPGTAPLLVVASGMAVALGLGLLAAGRRRRRAEP